MDSKSVLNYYEESIFKLLKKDIHTNIIYARIFTNKQKADLERQILNLSYN